MSLLPPKLNRPGRTQSQEKPRDIHEEVLSAIDAVLTERSVRVLVVDDQEDCAETLGMALEFLGYDVSICSTGLAGLAALERLVPCVAILDIGLPDISGYELARKITAAPWGKNVKLGAVTGWGTAHDSRDAEDAGFHARIVKPVEFAQLDTTIRNILSH